MHPWSFVISAFILYTFIAGLSAAEPVKNDPDRVVGKSLGKTIKARDIELKKPIDPSVKFDATDQANWELMGRVMTAFGKPILDRFEKEHKIEATAEEIKAFHESLRKSNARSIKESKARLAEVTKELNGNLSKEDKAKLEEEKSNLQQSLKFKREDLKLDDGIAKQFIVRWKTERELHRTFGGRVIFQQLGAEAVGASQRLFEQAEKQGDLQFDDAGVRHLFYYYANMKHVEVDAKTLDEPWFFRE